jgi:hypothetical protein
MKVVYVWGKTEIGKTSLIYKIEDEKYGCKPWSLESDTGEGPCAWDGYQGQESVLIDDYNDKMSRRFLLRLLDRYPMQVRITGGWRNFTSKRIYFTSEYPPDCWNWDAAIMRRVTEVIHKM